jgi:3-oxoacyl-[acyl-carrier protein] reductase
VSVSIVTGAARGIGRQIAVKLASDGHELLLVDRDPSVRTVAENLGGTCAQVDLTNSEGIDEIAHVVEAGGGGVRALVNNAGITRDGLIGTMTEEDFRLVLRVNLGAAHVLIERLRDQFVDGASIVSLSSRAYLGNIGQFNYAMSKGGVVGLTRALALALAPRVRVNAVAPGFIDSDMTRAVPPRVWDKVVAAIPMGRAGEQGEVADLVSYLSSSAASYITGQVLFVCGGRSVA